MGSKVLHLRLSYHQAIALDAFFKSAWSADALKRANEAHPQLNTVRKKAEQVALTAEFRLAERQRKRGVSPGWIK